MQVQVAGIGTVRSQGKFFTAFGRALRWLRAARAHLARKIHIAQFSRRITERIERSEWDEYVVHAPVCLQAFVVCLIVAAGLFFGWLAAIGFLVR